MLHLPLARVGVAMTAGQALALPATFLAGRLMDRVGPKRVVVWATPPLRRRFRPVPARPRTVAHRRRLRARPGRHQHVLRRVIAGARRGYHNTPLTRPGLAATDRDAALTLLRDTARRFAAGHGTTHWWPYLTARAAAALAPLYPGPPLHLEDDAVIPLPGTGFDDYVTSLPDGAGPASAANAATSPPPSRYAGTCSRTASRRRGPCSPDTSRTTGTTATASPR
ncbi:hypothetical protein STENM223S_00522 [Streptomyces tendae]